MRYPNLMVTTHHVMYTSATLWVVSSLLSFTTFWNLKFYQFAIAVNIVTCLLISAISYTKMYQIVRRHHLEIRAQQLAVERFNAEDNQNMKRSKRNAISTFIYYVVMILCYTPMFIGVSISITSHSLWKSAWVLAETVAFMNSSINPFLHCWRLRELRTAVVNTARQMLCKQTEEN